MKLKRLWTMEYVSPGVRRLVCLTGWIPYPEASAQLAAMPPDQRVISFMSSVSATEIKKHNPTLTFVK
jgi:hypothetical protein